MSNIQKKTLLPPQKTPCFTPDFSFTVFTNSMGAPDEEVQSTTR